ncbi:PucR family transcriptional regulator [Cohnella laeviribosi]|jgi:DNA-binding PucR family transcriptional regulator|uniref:PucR family transcriptional regulator n=1 Tax=Cohnella laeviribosi TaxID=380174 RepID=UPI00037E9F52|nr:PucR family transcriptional regulator [Cohnella laeviribosi]
MNQNANPFDQTFDNLDTLADAIYGALRCPVTIEDANHRLLAYSSHEDMSDPARISTIMGRKVPEKVISTLWRDGVMKRLLQSELPIRISAMEEIGLGDRVAVAIRRNQDVLGYIWLLEVNGPLGDQGLHQLKRAADAARSQLIQLQMKTRKEEKSYHDFFWQLLTGHLQPDERVRDRAKQLDVRLPERYHVTVLQFEEAISEKLKQQIRYTLETTPFVRIVLHAVTDAQLVLLAAAPSPSVDDEEEQKEALFRMIRQMKQRFGISPVESGSGMIYSDYAMVERSYQEALTLLQIKRRFPEETSSASAYPDLGYYRYLPHILQEKQLHRFENPALQKLRKYDREHNSDLLQTLELFLSHDSNVKVTADLLHIHINTLTYRLKRIAEIGGIDLNNMDQKVTLYLDLKAEKMTE